MSIYTLPIHTYIVHTYIHTRRVVFVGVEDDVTGLGVEKEKLGRDLLVVVMETTVVVVAGGCGNVGSHDFCRHSSHQTKTHSPSYFEQREMREVCRSSVPLVVLWQQGLSPRPGCHGDM